MLDLKRGNSIIENEIDVENSNGILLPKLFLPTVRKNCSSD
jgi:hypothetical protein